MNVRCALSIVCDGRMVDPADPLIYQRVEGWERAALGASRRSGRDIVARRQLVEYACPSCVDAARNGRPVQQESLL